MQAYLDAGFLLTSLIPTTQGGHIANGLLREIGAPFALNFLHQLQSENLMVALQKSGDRDRQMTGNEGQRLWRHYFAEGVFQMVPVDWDSAFRVAVTWNQQQVGVPPPFLLLLHPALAAVAGATHFLSFDPRSRKIARSSGMQILPERL